MAFSRTHPGRSRRIEPALLVAVALVLLSSMAGRASAETQIAPPGSGAGQVQIGEPGGIAVDSATGTLYVGDSGNRRVDVFDSAGNFIRAFGWGVVASGPDNNPRNQIEKVQVQATGGQFSLLFIQNGATSIGSIKQETGLLPFNASASALQTALEELPALAPGDVAVGGPAGGPWTVEFAGAFADTALHPLEEGGASALTGGSAELAISTTQMGANYEVCEATAGDVCRSGQLGAAAGQIKPMRIAVDPASHDVYVFDGNEGGPSYNESPDNRVQKFTPEGEFLYMLGGGVDLTSGEDLCTAASGHVCGRGSKGSGAGEFDNEISAVAVGPGGVLYVDDGGRVQKFEPNGAPLGQVALSGAGSGYLAVDSSGNLYAGTNAEVRKYSPAGTVLSGIPLSNINAVAVDSADNLYVSNLSSGRYGISRYDSSGSLNLVFYSSLGTLNTSGTVAKGLAPYPPAPGGDLFTIEKGTVNLLAFPAAGPVIYPNSESVFASSIGNVRGTLHSEVNPEGKSTTVHFEYVEQEFFESGGWSSPQVKESSESSPIGSDFTLHQVAQQVTGLTPETVYRFRAIATNSDAPGGIAGPDGTFETEPPLAIGGIWSIDVDTDSATLHAEVNPLGIAATGYFEYVDEAGYLNSGFATATKVPAGSPLDFGAGEGFVDRSAAIAALSPATTYRYRLVANDHCKPSAPAVICTFESQVAAFRTFPPQGPLANCPGNEAFRSGDGSLLADCRAYEMVTPVDKNNVNVEVAASLIGYPAGFDQSSPEGSRLSYAAYRAFAAPKSAPYTSQYLAGRTGAGWQSESLSPPREGGTLFNTAGLDSQFKAFTADLCTAWVLQDTPLLLTSDAVPGYPNLYTRKNCEPGSGSYSALTTVTPAGNLKPSLFFTELQGFSADGSRSFFSVPARLTPGVPSLGEKRALVYEVGGGGIEPVCVRPDASIVSSGCSLGTGDGFADERVATLAGAVSEDGSVAYWSENQDDPSKLFVRVGGQQTFQVSGEAAQFWTASTDGSTAIYTVGEKLFAFDLASKTSTPIAEGVSGVVGADGQVQRLYFVSSKNLAPGATPGEPNLYLYDGSYRWIGKLASGDVLKNKPSLVAPRPILRVSRVTPDGNRVVFMSKARLTGFDNNDAVTGEPDFEVFVYDATAGGGAGQLHCVSCLPSGARPRGRPFEIVRIANGSAAAWIPGWSNQLHAPRVISDDGDRIFFNSYDRLVLQDTNGKQDVYEWEAVGAGTCDEASSYFSAAGGGCITLVSSGNSSEDSAFDETSISGDDVFFKTYSSLVPQDRGLLDLYDARVGGGFASPPETGEECEGEGCLAPRQESSPSGAPQSQTFVGPGNQVSPSPKPKRCAKGRHKVRRKGKVVCVRNGKHRKHHSRAKGRAGR